MISLNVYNNNLTEMDNEIITLILAIIPLTGKNGALDFKNE